MDDCYCVLEVGMKKKYLAKILELSLAAALAITLSGCSKDRDIMEEPDITVEYLSGEYAEQILRDGGEEMLGTISIDKNGDNTYSLTVNSMLVVESDITDEGYYVADKNISTTVPLDSDARVTYIRDEESGPEVIELEEFIELTQNDTSDPLEEGNEKLYEVYTVGDNALMVLAKELPDAE